MNITWDKDKVLSAKEASVYATLNGRRFNLLSMQELEATLDIKKGEINVLRDPMVGHKMGSMTGKYKGKAYVVDSERRAAILEYKNSRKSPEYEIVITNDDPAVDIGAQTIVLKHCLDDSIVLAKVMAGDDFLEEDIEGTFDDWEMPDKFALMLGLEG